MGTLTIFIKFPCIRGKQCDYIPVARKTLENFTNAILYQKWYFNQTERRIYFWFSNVPEETIMGSF